MEFFKISLFFKLDRVTKIHEIPNNKGNALAYSSAYIQQEAFNAKMSQEEFLCQTAFNLTKSIEGGTPLTLVEYHLENSDDSTSPSSIIYSFLNFEWAIVSDVDYESEKYRRSLGSARFTFVALQRIAFLRVYRGKLSFIQANSNDEWTHLNEQNYVLLLISCLPLISRDFMSSPHIKSFDESHVHLTFVTEGITKCQLIKLFLSTNTGQHLNMNNVHVHNYKIKEFRFEPIIGNSNRNRREGIMMIDGERVAHHNRVYGRVRPGMARVLTR